MSAGFAQKAPSSLIPRSYAKALHKERYTLGKKGRSLSKEILSLGHNVNTTLGFIVYKVERKGFDWARLLRNRCLKLHPARVTGPLPECLVVAQLVHNTGRHRALLCAHIPSSVEPPASTAGAPQLSVPTALETDNADGPSAARRARL